MTNFILFGPPGSGKGTQAAKLKERFNLLHISTGDLLRDEKERETPLGLEAKNFMDQGLLVPDEIIIGMISSCIDEHEDAQGIICDGFPRTVDQAVALDNLLDVKGSQILALLSLDVEEGELKRRLMERGKTSGRVDDQDSATHEKRIQQYRDKTEPVANYYREQDKFIAIKGEGDIETIFADLANAMDALIS